MIISSRVEGNLKEIFKCPFTDAPRCAIFGDKSKYMDSKVSLLLILKSNIQHTNNMKGNKLENE